MSIPAANTGLVIKVLTGSQLFDFLNGMAVWQIAQ
jgi:hypothetical protein